ncbi:MAG TPA: oligosaccharide flippase family protein [Thermoplasmata archaeon]|nr:oligosaccharide flippase family protein [Thermoplasmata archaeon]
MDPASPTAASAPGNKPAVPKPALSLTLSSGAVFGASLGIQVLGVVASYFLYHHIGNVSNSGAALLGTVQLFLLIGTSINGIGDLRIGTAYTFFLARGKSASDNTTVYLLVRMAMVGVVGLVLFVLAPLSVDGYRLVLGNVEWTSLGIFLVLPLLWSFTAVYSNLYIGLGNSLKAQYPSLVEALARLPVLIFCAYYDPTVEGLTLAYVVGALASTIYAAPAVLRQMRRFRRAEAFHLFRFAWPLMGSLLLNYLVTNMIPFLVAFRSGTAELNAFLLANGFRILVLSLPAAVTTPLFPYIAGLHRQDEHDAVRRGTWQALRYTSMLLVPGVVALVTYRSTFLAVLGGSRYVAVGSWPLAILVVGAIPLALSQIMQSSINAIGRQRLELYITSTQVVVLFSATFLLYDVLPAGDDLIAAAIAVLLSSSAALLLNTYFLETLLKVRIQLRSVLGITLGAALAFGVISRFNKPGFLPAQTGYQLAGVIVLCFAVYFVVLALIGELTKSDVRQIGRSIGLPARFCDQVARLCWRGASPELAPATPDEAPGLRQPELPDTFTGTRELPDIGEPLPSVHDDEPKLPPP